MFNSYQYSNSSDDLLKKMNQQAQKDGVGNQIFEVLKQFFEKELGKENRPLSRSERLYLFKQVIKVILTDVLGKVDDMK